MMQKHAVNDSQTEHLHPALANWRTKSSPVMFGDEMRDRHPSTQGKGDETSLDVDSSSRKESTSAPKTFQDILSAHHITTSSLSEAGYMGYRKSKFRGFKSVRASTLPIQPSQQTLELHDDGSGGNVPSTTTTTTTTATMTSRRSTLKKMKGMMNSFKRSISFVNDSGKKKSRPPIPSSSDFPGNASQSRFGTGTGRRSYRRQDGGYLTLSDGDDAMSGDR